MSFPIEQEQGRPLAIKDEGVTIAPSASSIDFAGAGVTGTAVGSAVTETIPGGGGGGSPGAPDFSVQINDGAGGFAGTDLLYTAATGNWGLGATPTTTDSWKFVKTLTPAAGTTVGQRIESYSNASAGGTVHVGQLLQGGSTPGNAQNFSQLGGSQSAAVHAGTGLVDENIGTINDTLLSSSGNAAWGYAGIFRVRGTSTGIYTLGAIGAWILTPQLSGGSTVQDLYGLYIDPQTSGLGVNYAIYYNNTTSGFYVTGDGKTGIGVVSPTYRLDVAGDIRVTATTNQQFIYVNNSPIEGLKAQRVEVSSASGTINYSGFIAALTSGVAKSAGTTIGFEASFTPNGADSGGSYIAFSSGNMVASSATQTAFSVGTGWDQAMSIAEGPIRWTGGKAVVATDYSITRDADATNQMHFNVPTGSTFEFSVNDVYTLGINNTGIRIAPSAASSGNPNIASIILPANTGITASTEVPFVKVDLSAVQTWATGNISIQRFFEVTQPTMAFAGASTLQQGIATFCVDGPPLSGTNATISGGTFTALFGSPGGTTNSTSTYGVGFLTPALATGMGAMTDHAAFIVGYPGGNVGMTDQTATTVRYAGGIFKQQTLLPSGVNVRTFTDAINLDIEGCYIAGGTAVITNGPFAARINGKTTLKNIAGSITRAVTIPDYTVTLATTTQVTSSGMAAVGIGQVTLAQSGGAVTVDNFSSLYVKGPGIAGASVTITKNTAAWFDSGIVLVDDQVAIGDLDSMTVNGSAISNKLQIHSTDGTTNTDIEMHRHGATAASGVSIYGARSRGTAASPTVVQSGDVIANYTGVGFDGTDYATACQIQFEVDGTPGSNDMPGRIVFNTSSDGSQTLTERVRISQDGTTKFSYGVIYPYVTKTANYTLTVADYAVNCTTNSFDITLPTAAGYTGIVFVVKNSGSGKTITMKTTGGQTMDGIASGALTLAYLDSYTFISDGSNWIIV